jgi:ribosome-binding protein aMBF1 (putative translation factor)
MKVNCDRDCLKCLYPEMPKRCERLPVTQWEWDVLHMAHSESIQELTKEQKRSKRKRYDAKRWQFRKYAEEQACIAQARKSRGLSQKALSRAVGCAQSTLCAWELGRFVADWDKLCAVLPELEKYRPDK